MQDNVDSQLVHNLAQRLQRENLTLATAESCTGGGIGYYLTSVSGSSDWYLGGFITYSNQAKVRDLGVQQETLNRFGAVSEEVAEQMAIGCATRSGSNFALSVTGIAGPDGGTADKPVGTVCFGWAGHDKVRSHTKLFSGDRSEVRLQTIEYALIGVENFLDEFSTKD